VNLWLEFVILSLATFRLTRLITKDDFPPIFYARRWVQSRRPAEWRRPARVGVRGAGPDALFGEEPYADYWWFGELVSCAWCASAYVSGALVLFVWLLHGLPLPLLWWFAVWGAGAFLAHLSER
jgi:hypothetical protein